jgi:hypothetical protein
LQAAARPLGITFLTLLQILLGILELLGAAALAFINYVLPEMYQRGR